jgi:hypothetical protein
LSGTPHTTNFRFVIQPVQPWNSFADLNVSINGNRVRGLVPDGTGHATGIENLVSGRAIFRNNDLVGNGGGSGIGILCSDANGLAIDNTINGFATGLDTCSNDGGNVIAP